jgi:hypothetical protein
MKTYIVTVKFTARAGHDPRNKQTAACPAIPSSLCTDATGAHHSFLVDANDMDEVRVIVELSGYNHITRIEEAVRIGS